MHKLAFIFIGLLFISSAQAGVVRKNIPNAKPVGSGILKVLVWEVYRATLYAPAGQWSKSRPFALSLRYLRSVSGHEIADLSVKEIRKLGYNNEIKLAAWHTQMRKIFPNVSNGTILTGIYNPGKPTFFYKGSRQIGSIKDPEFGRWFFNIWLSRKTSAPKLRSKLLGLK